MKQLFSLIASIYCVVAFGATTVPIQLLNPTGSTAGQAIVSTGASSAPAWGGVGVNGIAAIPANTVLANVTGSSASPTASSVPICLGTSFALTYTTSTGFGCNGTINALTVSGSAIGTSGGAIPLLNGINTWSGAQTFSAAITPSSGIVGTATNNNASAGNVGEYSNNSTTGTSLTTSTASNATSEPLTAGDWDVQCTAQFNPAAGTVTSRVQAGVSTTSANISVSLGAKSLIQGSLGTGLAQVVASPTVRISLASTTTVFCVVESAFTTSTMTVDGFIRARRPR